MIPVNRPAISESDLFAVTETLKSSWISGESPSTSNMEDLLEEILGISHVIAVNSGTTAIDLAIEALDIKSGDECVVPTFTIISSVANLLRHGARIKVVDCDSKTWSMDTDLTMSAITAFTKLVVPVHIYGLPVDMDPIMKTVENKDIFVLEDAAEALGLQYKGRHCGSIGNAGIFSFYANKIVTGGEGGAIVTSDSKFADKLRNLRNLCFNPKQRFVHDELGWNSRLNGLSAALITSQLFRLQTLVEAKIAIGKRYLTGLDGHPWLEFQPQKTDYAENTYWVFGAVLRDDAPFDAEAIQLELRKLGVDTRRFFCPIHLQPLAKRYEISPIGSMNVSERLWSRGFYLPSGLGNTIEELDRSIDALWQLVKK